MTIDATYQPWVPPDRGFYVYRTWGRDGQSIYIGMVGFNGPAYLSHRLRQHEARADWWPEVARIDWAEFGGTRETLDEEARQIAAQVPIHNKARPLPREPGAAARPKRRPNRPRWTPKLAPNLVLGAEYEVSPDTGRLLRVVNMDDPRTWPPGTTFTKITPEDRVLSLFA